MKGIRFIIGLFIFVLAVWVIVNRLPKSSKVIRIPPFSSAPSVTPSDIPIQTIVFKDKTYAYAFFSVSPENQVMLLPNFTDKASSLDIAAKNSCIYGINGGFYDTNSMPLGGFKSLHSLVKKPVKNRLIDGFIWQSDTKRAITLSEPPDDSQWYLQTGPLLYHNSVATSISIANDEYRRRSVAGISKDNHLFFFSIYNPESVYEGPLLSDMPSIMNQINAQEPFVLVEAINLDGGSASAFVTKEKTLQEFSPIGSFFCAK